MITECSTFGSPQLDIQNGFFIRPHKAMNGTHLGLMLHNG